MKTIVLIGGGGREHAIALQLRKSAKESKLVVMPGNAGIAMIPNTECLQIPATDIPAIVSKCKELKPDLVFVAPDDPLSLGLVDRLTEMDIRTFGPTQAASEVEWSKAFSKDFMSRHNIPTAAFRVFSDYNDAVKYVHGQEFPLVLKASGLALGKGVIIANNREDALSSLEEMMVEKKFGSASDNVVIEEFLTGTEVTLLVFTDGVNYSLMPTSQDHKRAFDGDLGPNTGGMGAFSPATAWSKSVESEVIKSIVEPTIKGLHQEGRKFKGVLYFGLMVGEKGTKVIEYNARFGDPETQTILPLLKTNFIQIVDACIDGTLDKLNIEWQDMAALCVVIAAREYPATVTKGHTIEINALHDDIQLIHCATLQTDTGLVTNGGRVFNVTAIADTIQNARQLVYAEIDKVKFAGARYRSDIGAR